MSKSGEPGAANRSGGRTRILRFARLAMLWSFVLIASVIVLVLVIVGVGLLGRRPLSPAGPLARAVPNLSVPAMGSPPIEVCWVETGHAFGSGALSMTASGLLIRHPEGDVLVDGGNSSRFDQEAADFPLLRRWVMKAIPGRLKPRILLSAGLRALGERDGEIRWLLPSHVHLDHVGGYEDLPLTPVLLTDEELRYATNADAQRTGAVIPQQASLVIRQAQPLHFSPVPYEVFDRHFDLYGDGSIVVVPLPGHTPGSVGIFIHLSPHQRIFYVGDAALTDAEIAQRLRKPFFIHDEEPQQADQEVRVLNRLHELIPELHMLPAHGRADFLKTFPKGPGSCLSSGR